MNILLWVLQVVLAFLCISGGVFQIFKIDDLKKGVSAMRALPRGLWAFLGAFGCVGGLGLIVPGALGAMPGLTAIAAAAVAAQSLFISALYLRYGDRAPLPYSAIMAALAAFIAFGRFVLSPLA
jgi:hypothetical protein